MAAKPTNTLTDTEHDYYADRRTEITELSANAYSTTH